MAQYPGMVRERVPLPIATMLTPAERIRVDAAGEGSYLTLHRDSVAELVQDLKSNRAGAVVLSVARCDHRARAGVAALVREFPRVPTIALLTQLDRSTPHTMLSLGSTGLRQLVDVRDADGWRELRDYLLNARGDDIQREALGALAIDLSSVHRDCWRFFEALFVSAPRVSTVRMLARELDVLPSTLMSRFFRARLPAPKQYLATARLVRAARLFENPGFSVANVANHLDYSSPQSFGRHVRTVMQLTAVQFRERYDGEGMLQHFRDSVVLPYLDQLRDLRPLNPSWTSSYAGRFSH
ncbi:MAG TPA: helix-turn-helix domain-containing protein [Gemmatimonadaceae bacterium]|jgi:AraC-like DNA-binding protein|nr:helix-turn-helix domain-containing protein [Gemmatimonadaceae bacterium]